MYNINAYYDLSYDLITVYIYPKNGAFFFDIYNK